MKIKNILLLVLLVTFSGCNEPIPNPTIETETETENDDKGENQEEEETEQEITYPIVGTGQINYFNNNSSITAPQQGDDFYGQDANFKGTTPSYTNNGDGTITDNVTKLIWQKEYQVMGYSAAIAAAEQLGNGWRLPTIKEAYSLILFSGIDATSGTVGTIPFIDTNFFDFSYAANGERDLDSQLLTATLYVGLTMGGDKTVFGVNFADGRIKGYPVMLQGVEKEYMVRFVKGESYGINLFVDNNNGTITDQSTGLMWSKADSKIGMNWEEALAYAQQLNAENYLGYSDWRLPNAKELQSIVDYSRSPQTTASAAIDPIFEISTIVNEAGASDYPYFWSSTTHESPLSSKEGAQAVYFSFGEALGYMTHYGAGNWMDVHGAGAQRSDPKTGSASNYPTGFGPQGDAIRISNYVRVVRNEYN